MGSGGWECEEHVLVVSTCFSFHIQALRPDRMQSTTARVVSTLLNMDVASTPAFSLGSLLHTQQPQQQASQQASQHSEEPVLFTTGPGADPTQVCFVLYCSLYSVVWVDYTCVTHPTPIHYRSSVHLQKQQWAATATMK